MSFQFLNAQPGLRVNDLDDATAYYEQFGFRAIYRNGDVHQVMHKDQVVIHLSTIEGGPGGGQIMVDDVAQVYELAQRLNLRVLHDGLGDRPWGCRDFTIEDPDGNGLTFSQQL